MDGQPYQFAVRRRRRGHGIKIADQQIGFHPFLYGEGVSSVGAQDEIVLPERNGRADRLIVVCLSLIHIYFRVDAFEKNLPTTTDAILKYLSRGVLRGIGAVSYTPLDVYKRQPRGLSISSRCSPFS